MGLCKCPKRQVTNQFCFEHRVNVCEHCMITTHPKCVVQSYIQWLEDSDYNPICEICNETLGNKECLRLTCYHVFHWPCLESKFRSLPRTTAPAGFQCPLCRASLFPPSNLVSLVADVLREKLAGVNWARAGLGLPLLCEDLDSKITSINNSSLAINNDNRYGPNGHIINGSSYSSEYSTHSEAIGMSTPHRVTPIGASDDESNSAKPKGPPYSVVQVQDDNGYDSSAFGNRGDNYQGGHQPRKIFEALDQNRHKTKSFDHDEDKYKRKSALEWIIRWWKNMLPPARNRRSTGHFNRRNLMAFILVAIVVFTLVVILMKIGRASIENDPALDAEHNPNIRFQQGKKHIT